MIDISVDMKKPPSKVSATSESRPLPTTPTSLNDTWIQPCGQEDSRHHLGIKVLEQTER
jgi:hypothetical protein